eukprot:CAMPEP_0174233468 /NCGR_PEP_ID=MMETSP0417-20130205/3494_1 /TAXON_ID=242541 /ORGANISM="Mayorella sp, Strain BSH-02190019" /LENGTH=2236 /DNA_ID=CAMNT_0015311683 /DNA_START=81 /DNA_END=6788 /DNA_ORIENTATION=-
MRRLQRSLSRKANVEDSALSHAQPSVPSLSAAAILPASSLPSNDASTVQFVVDHVLTNRAAARESFQELRSDEEVAVSFAWDQYEERFEALEHQSADLPMPTAEGKHSTTKKKTKKSKKSSGSNVSSESHSSSKSAKAKDTNHKHRGSHTQKKKQQQQKKEDLAEEVTSEKKPRPLRQDNFELCVEEHPKLVDLMPADESASRFNFDQEVAPTNSEYMMSLQAMYCLPSQSVSCSLASSRRQHRPSTAALGSVSVHSARKNVDEQVDVGRDELHINFAAVGLPGSVATVLLDTESSTAIEQLPSIVAAPREQVVKDSHRDPSVCFLPCAYENPEDTLECNALSSPTANSVEDLFDQFLFTVKETRGAHISAQLLTITELNFNSEVDLSEPIFLEVSIWRVSATDPNEPATRYSTNYDFTFNLESLSHLDTEDILSEMEIPSALFLASAFRDRAHYRYYMLFVASRLPLDKDLWRKSLKAYHKGTEAIGGDLNDLREGLNQAKQIKDLNTSNLARRPFAAGKIPLWPGDDTTHRVPKRRHVLGVPRMRSRSQSDLSSFTSQDPRMIQHQKVYMVVFQKKNVCKWLTGDRHNTLRTFFEKPIDICDSDFTIGFSTRDVGSSELNNVASDIPRFRIIDMIGEKVPPLLLPWFRCRHDLYLFPNHITVNVSLCQVVMFIARGLDVDPTSPGLVKGGCFYGPVAGLGSRELLNSGVSALYENGKVISGDEIRIRLPLDCHAGSDQVYSIVFHIYKVDYGSDRSTMRERLACGVFPLNAKHLKQLAANTRHSDIDRSIPVKLLNDRSDEVGSFSFQGAYVSDIFPGNDKLSLLFNTSRMLRNSSQLHERTQLWARILPSNEPSESPNIDRAEAAAYLPHCLNLLLSNLAVCDTERSSFQTFSTILTLLEKARRFPFIRKQPAFLDSLVKLLLTHWHPRSAVGLPTTPRTELDSSPRVAAEAAGLSSSASSLAETLPAAAYSTPAASSSSSATLKQIPLHEAIVRAWKGYMIKASAGVTTFVSPLDVHRVLFEILRKSMYLEYVAQKKLAPGKHRHPLSKDRCSLFPAEFRSDLLEIMERLYLASYTKGFFDELQDCIEYHCMLARFTNHLLILMDRGQVFRFIARTFASKKMPALSQREGVFLTAHFRAFLILTQHPLLVELNLSSEADVEEIAKLIRAPSLECFSLFARTVWERHFVSGLLVHEARQAFALADQSSTQQPTVLCALRALSSCLLTLETLRPLSSSLRALWICTAFPFVEFIVAHCTRLGRRLPRAEDRRAALVPVLHILQKTMHRWQLFQAWITSPHLPSSSKLRFIALLRECVRLFPFPQAQLAPDSIEALGQLTGDLRNSSSLFQDEAVSSTYSRATDATATRATADRQEALVLPFAVVSASYFEIHWTILESVEYYLQLLKAEVGGSTPDPVTSTESDSVSNSEEKHPRPTLGGITWQGESFSILPDVVANTNLSSFYRSEIKHILFSILLECLASNADTATRCTSRYRCFIAQVYRTSLYFFHVMSEKSFLAGGSILQLEGQRTVLLLSCILRHAMDPFIRAHAVSLLLWIMKATHAMQDCETQVKERLENFRFQVQVALHAESLLCKENRDGLVEVLSLLNSSLDRDQAVDQIMSTQSWDPFRASAREMLSKLSDFLKLHPWYYDDAGESTQVPRGFRFLADEEHVDFLLQCSVSLAHNPMTRASFLEQLSAVHAAHGRPLEAAQVCIHVAYVYALYVDSQDHFGLPIKIAPHFRHFDPNLQAAELRYQAPHLVIPTEKSEWGPSRVISFLQNAVTYFLSDEKGEATPNNVDLALEVNLFVGTLIKTCLQDLHQLETWSEKQLNIIRKINEKQALVKSEGPTYYFVGFFGDKLGVYNGLQFVYRFADRREALSVETYLQTSFSTGGIELGEIHHSLEELSALNETVASARIVVLKLQPRIKQINSLQPTANQRHHGVNQFVYVTQKKPSECPRFPSDLSKEDLISLQEHWANFVLERSRTHFHTQFPFPYISHRSEVVDSSPNDSEPFGSSEDDEDKEEEKEEEEAEAEDDEDDGQEASDTRSIRLGERLHRTEHLSTIRSALDDVLEHAAAFEQALSSQRIDAMFSCLFEKFVIHYAHAGFAKAYMWIFLHREVRAAYPADLVTKLSRALLDLLLMAQENFRFWSGSTMTDRLRSAGGRYTEDGIRDCQHTIEQNLNSSLELLKGETCWVMDQLRYSSFVSNWLLKREKHMLVVNQRIKGTYRHV